MKRALLIASVFLAFPLIAFAQSASPWLIAGTGNHFLKPVTNQLGLQVPGLATSSTGCLSVNSTGWISANGSACGSGGGSSFGKTWEIIAAGYLAPTSTITALLNNGFVSQASSTVAGAFTVTGTAKLAASLSGLLKATAGTVSAATAGTDYENPLTFSTGLTRSTNTITVNTTQNITKLSNLTTNGIVKTSGGDGTLSVDTSTYATFGYPFPSNATTSVLTFTNGASVPKLTNLTTNGFVKTSGGDGTLSIDTSTYLTGNQTITLSGDVSGSGSTAITTTIGALKVLGSMIANATIDLATKVTGILPIANGGTASSTALGGILVGNGTSAIKSAVIGSGLSFDGTTLSATGGSGGAAYPFGLAGNATSTLTQFNGGLTALASSTIGDGTLGLTNFGAATTTGNAYFAGNVGIGTTSPWGNLSVINSGGTTPGFVVSSNSDVPQLIVDSAGKVGIATSSSLSSAFVVSGNATIGADYAVAAPTNGLLVEGQIGAGTTSPSSAPFSSGAAIVASVASNNSGCIFGMSRRSVMDGCINALNGAFALNAAGANGNVGFFQFNEGTAVNGTQSVALGIRNYQVSVGTSSLTTSGAGHFNIWGRGCSVTGGSLCKYFMSITNSDLGSANYGDILNVDSSGRLGVGTTTPWAQLSASSTSSYPTFAVQQNGSGAAGVFLGGNVGIGTTSPFAVLSLDRFGIASSTIAVNEYNYGSATTTSELIDCRSATQTHIRIGTAATTLQINSSSLIPGQTCRVVVENPNASAGAITWTVSSGAILKWVGGITPTQTTTANAMDVWSFIATQGSSTKAILGAQSANF